MPEFEKKKVAIVGVSNDKKEKNANFASECGFSYPLICDTDLAVSVAYGAAASATAGSASRIAVLINENGKVKSYWPAVDARKFPEECLASL